MIPVDDAERIFEAMDDMVARMQELQGADLETKLAMVGLDADGVHAVLAERWELAEPNLRGVEAYLAYTQGFLEGLLLRTQLAT